VPGTDARERAGNELQATLVELPDLALTGRQLRWSVVGPQFRSLRRRLDEPIDALRALAGWVYAGVLEGEVCER